MTYEHIVSWLNEMGKVQSSYHDTLEEKHAKINALSEDGYICLSDVSEKNL